MLIHMINRIPKQLLGIALLTLATAASAFTTLDDNLSNAAHWDTFPMVDPTGVSFTAGGAVITATTNNYQRQDIAYQGAPNNDFSWVSQTTNITYSFNIASFPTGTDKTKYEAHLYLIGNAGSLAPNYIDYNAANVLFVRIYQNGDGIGAELRYKDGSPACGIYEPQYGGCGSNLGGIYQQPTALGTWGVTISGGGTSVTFFGPSGTLLTANLPASALTHFNTDVQVAVGVNPDNATVNIGQSATISRVRVYQSGANGSGGGFTPLDSNLTSSNGWSTAAAVDPAGITFTGSGAQICPTALNYQREDVSSLANTYSWVGESSNITYSFNIANFPAGTDKLKYEAHLLLVGNNGSSAGNYIDYNATNVLFLRVFQNGDGIGAELRYKAGSPQCGIYEPADGGCGVKLGGIYQQATAIGTWGFTIQGSGTNITVFGPGGTLFSTNLPSSALTSFNKTIHLALGVSPDNTAANSGQCATISRVQAVRASGGNIASPVITVVKSGANLNISYTGANGVNYQLQSRASLSSGTWGNEGSSVTGSGGVITQPVAIGSGAKFFRVMAQ